MSTIETSGPRAGAHSLHRAIGAKLLLFLVIGDMLGTGIYALTGDVAGEVGGAAWLAFGAAFLVAMFTATSYLELVGKYPRAAGAALYTHEAFGSRVLTFFVAFAVMCSGLTSVGAASRTFAGYAAEFVVLPPLLVALLFVVVLAAINYRGVAESVRLNVVLTAIELSGLLIVIAVGMAALGGGAGDPAKALEFNADRSPFALVISGATLAFFAIVGFEDSINLVEETKDPRRNFPRAFFLGITLTAVVYMLVAFVTTTLVPIDVLRDSNQDLLEVIRVGAKWFPLTLFSFIAMCAVTNTSLINLMMASRLIYGMAREGVVPETLGAVHSARRTPWVAILFTTAIALGLASWGGVRALGGTTALLLLCVFTLVNAAVLVLRARPVDHDHFRAPTLFPILGMFSCAYLASPWSGRDLEQYRIAGVLLLLGLVLFGVNWLVHGRRVAPLDAARLGKD
ncbi:MAG TPA: APC family permease [Gammaproteobacteria bacterium]|nr:APC family permease [Gammaproteobacteria bacterium]